MGMDLVPTNQQMLALRSMDDLERFARTISQSIFVPQPFRGKPGDVIAAVLYGMERGLSPMASLQNVAVINGKPSVYGDMLLAICMSDPSTESIDEAESEEIDQTGIAWCTAKRLGRKLVRRTFSRKDAERAHLWNKAGPWQEYPSRMLMMRARSWCLRDAYADRLMGLQAREEAQDSMIDVTPTSAPAPAPLATPMATGAASVAMAGEQGSPPPGMTTSGVDVPNEPAPPVVDSSPPPAALPARKPIEKMNQQECVYRLQDELKRLCGSGQDPTTRQQRTDILVAVFGAATDTVAKATLLGKTPLQAGLRKLAVMVREEPPTETPLAGGVPPDGDGHTSGPMGPMTGPMTAEEDVPLHSPPMDGPQEGHLLPQGATIDGGPSKVDVADVHGDVEDAPEPPVEPRMAGMVVDPGDVRILSLWAAMNGQIETFTVMVEGKPIADGTPILSRPAYKVIRKAVADGIARAEVVHAGDHARETGAL